MSNLADEEATTIIRELERRNAKLVADLELAKVDADNLRYAVEKISTDANEQNAKLVAALDKIRNRVRARATYKELASMLDHALADQQSTEKL